MQLLNRIKNLLLQPKKEWTVIRNEKSSIDDFFFKYLGILIALPFVILVIRFGFIGHDLPYRYNIEGTFYIGILHGLNYVTALVSGIFLSALYVFYLSDAFDIKITYDIALKLVGYSFTPLFLSSIFLLIPNLSTLNFTGLYGLVIYYSGVKTFVALPKNQLHKFYFFSVAGIVCLSLFAFIVFALLINSEASMFLGLCY
jgi:hypothetical protein